jgi:hypothetical protein
VFDNSLTLKNDPSVFLTILNRKINRMRPFIRLLFRLNYNAQK